MEKLDRKMWYFKYIKKARISDYRFDNKLIPPFVEKLVFHGDFSNKEIIIPSSVKYLNLINFTQDSFNVIFSSSPFQIEIHSKCEEIIESLKINCKIRYYS